MAVTGFHLLIHTVISHAGAYGETSFKRGLNFIFSNSHGIALAHLLISSMAISTVSLSLIRQVAARGEGYKFQAMR
jgi:hypothetical protein